MDRLRDLGLRPEGLLWVYHIKETRFVLWLIWSGVDSFGPFELSKLLFSAYRTSLLPRKIDPLQMRVSSPRIVDSNIMLRASGDLVSSHKTAFQIATKVPAGRQAVDEDSTYEVRREWVYHLKMKPRSVIDIRDDWNRFKQHVDAAAA